MAWLQIQGEDGFERAVELGAPSLRIGRSPGNDIVLSDEQKRVSRTHAELRLEGGSYVIVDLQSQNGTWLNAERVTRAELPFEGEVTVGAYRLRLKDGPAPGTVVNAPPVSAVPAPRWSDAVIARPVASESQVPPPPARRSKVAVGAAVGVAAAVVAAVLAWSHFSTAPDTAGTATQAPQGQTANAHDAPPAPGATAATPPPDSAPPVPAPVVSAPAVSVPPAPAPVAVVPAPAPPVASAASELRAARPSVPRRPEESVEAWNDRIAALETRYEYSKAALDRGDFGAAASGFEAILRAEPGFRDVPDLLVRARAGLRAAAAELIKAGTRLETSGDWMGALEEYERASEIDAGAPGIDAGIARVREKLRAAGADAFDRGRDADRRGDNQTALREYAKAVQWLPADDPNREIARVRADALRTTTKD